MANIFSPQEILRIAIKVEENGENLYEALESKAQNEKLKSKWHYLKEQEEAHAKTFQEMLDKVGDYVVYEFSPGEYEAYLRAIASGYIFTQELIEKKTKELFHSDLEAIEFGIYIEKESIFVYSALKEYILAEKQPVLNKVIDEEKKHLGQLHLLKEQIKGSEI
jgi:rubrerythrin